MGPFFLIPDLCSGRLFPGAFVGAVVTILYAVVEVAGANGAEAGVVHGRRAEGFGEVFGEAVEGLQVLGEGRQFVAVAGDEEHLVATVDEAGDLFAMDHEAGFADFRHAFRAFGDFAAEAAAGDQRAFDGESSRAGGAQTVRKSELGFFLAAEEHITTL